MKVQVTVGDVLDAAADVLISTANPWLNMSGGVNGAIRERAPSVQTELHKHLESIGDAAVPAGTVVQTSAGELPFLHIIHAVAIDPFYDSSQQLVADTLTVAFQLAVSLNAKSVSLPTLATGYGPMSIDAFAFAFADAIPGQFDVPTVTIVVRSDENAKIVDRVIASG